MDQEARISISIKDGKVEISGPESFVREQIENFKDLILKNLSSFPAQQPAPSEQPAGEVSVIPSTPEVDLSYKNVIAIDGDEIKILKSIPGKNKAEKTVNTALIYLHGKSLKGEESANFNEIRKLCKEHACLDAANFSSTIKTQKELFLITGSGKSQVAKLTHPGKTKAAELVSKLNAQ